MEKIVVVCLAFAGLTFLAVANSLGHQDVSGGVLMLVGLLALAGLAALCARAFGGHGAAAPGAAGAHVRAAVAFSWSTFPVLWCWLFGLIAIWAGLYLFSAFGWSRGGVAALLVAVAISTVAALIFSFPRPVQAVAMGIVRLICWLVRMLVTIVGGLLGWVLRLPVWLSIIALVILMGAGLWLAWPLVKLVFQFGGWLRHAIG